MKNFKKTLLGLTLLSTPFLSYSQDTLLVEDFGTPIGQVPIASYNGWDSKKVSYEGSAFLRCLTTSSTCSEFIRSGNVLLGANQYLKVSNINLKGDSSITISFAMYNRYASATPDSLKFYASSDNQSWKECFLLQFPQSAGWALHETTLRLPKTDKMFFKVDNVSKKCMFWLDHLVVAQNNLRSTSDLKEEHIADEIAESIQLRSQKNGVCRFYSDSQVYVYNLSGNLIQKLPAGENSISLESGVYIFKSINSVKKVLISNL